MRVYVFSFYIYTCHAGRHVCIHAYCVIVSAYMYICMYVYIYRQKCILCIYVHMYMYMCIFTYTYVSTFIYIYICIHTLLVYTLEVSNAALLRIALCTLRASLALRTFARRRRTSKARSWTRGLRLSRTHTPAH